MFYTKDILISLLYTLSLSLSFTELNFISFNRITKIDKCYSFNVIMQICQL